jgi:hypothetical protein
MLVVLQDSRFKMILCQAHSPYIKHNIHISGTLKAYIHIKRPNKAKLTRRNAMRLESCI